MNDTTKTSTSATSGELTVAHAEHYRAAIFTVCEGWTLPPDARKLLEAALWAGPEITSQPVASAPVQADTILTWQERAQIMYGDEWQKVGSLEQYMNAEIADLRAALPQQVQAALKAEVRAAREEALEEAAKFLEMQIGLPESEVATIRMTCYLIRHLKCREAGWVLRSPASTEAEGK